MKFHVPKCPEMSRKCPGGLFFSAGMHESAPAQEKNSSHVPKCTEMYKKCTEMSGRRRKKTAPMYRNVQKCTKNVQKCPAGAGTKTAHVSHSEFAVGRGKTNLQLKTGRAVCRGLIFPPADGLALGGRCCETSNNHAVE
jgi:hypothetical protein